MTNRALAVLKGIWVRSTIGPDPPAPLDQSVLYMFLKNVTFLHFLLEFNLPCLE